MGTLSVPTEHGLTTFWASLALRAALSAHALGCNLQDGQRPAPRAPRRRAWLIFELFGFREGDLYPSKRFRQLRPRSRHLVKGYKSGAADTECKVTFTNGPETWHVGEFGQCASSGDCDLSTSTVQITVLTAVVLLVSSYSTNFYR